MTRTITGIDGILGSLLSPAAGQCPPPARIAQEEAKSAFPMPEVPPAKKLPATDRTGARRGRPVGRSAPGRPSKEKVTLQIGTNLIAEYRDWSWDARCHLSALVERALTEYQGRFRKPRRD